MNYKTIHPSSLYWKIHKIYYIGNVYIKLRATFYYKHSHEECTITYKKNIKVLKNVYENWVNYTP